MCSKVAECDSFTFNPFLPEESKCKMYTRGRLAPSTVGEVSAWCPKGDWQDINPLFPESSPLEESSYLRCTIKETGFENRNGDVSPGEGSTNTANTTTTTTTAATTTRTTRTMTTTTTTTTESSPAMNFSSSIIVVSIVSLLTMNA